MKPLSKFKSFIKCLMNLPVITVFTRKQKQKAAELQELLDKFETTYKQMKMYKVFWDCSAAALALVRMSDAKILDVNPAACALYGYTREEAIGGLTLANIVMDANETAVIFKERAESLRYRWHKKSNGERICVSVRLTYLNDFGYDVVAASIIERRGCDERRASDILPEVWQGSILR